MRVLLSAIVFFWEVLQINMVKNMFLHKPIHNLIGILPNSLLVDMRVPLGIEGMFRVAGQTHLGV